MTRLPSRFSKALSFVFAFAVVAAVAAATPASAAGADDQGWFVFLDLANTQPTSLDQHFADHTDFNVTPFTTERLVIDNDADLTFKVGGGYGFGNGNGSLRVSYWSFDNDDEQSGSVNGALYPTVFNGYYAQYLYNAAGVTYTATSSTKASTIDVDYVREIVAGKKSSLMWLAGLRIAHFEEDLDFEGNDGTLYLSERHMESDGTGLRVGAVAEFPFTEHFAMKSSLVFSFLQADSDGEGSNTIAAAPPLETSEASDDNIKGEMRDFDVKAVWTFGALSYFVGYEASQWDGMVMNPLPRNGFNFGSGESRDSIAFNSLHAGVAWHIGGKKK